MNRKTGQARTFHYGEVALRAPRQHRAAQMTDGIPRVDQATRRQRIELIGLPRRRITVPVVGITSRSTTFLNRTRHHHALASRVAADSARRGCHLSAPVLPTQQGCAALYCSAQQRNYERRVRDCQPETWRNGIHTWVESEYCPSLSWTSRVMCSHPLCHQIATVVMSTSRLCSFTSGKPDTVIHRLSICCLR